MQVYRSSCIIWYLHQYVENISQVGMFWMGTRRNKILLRNSDGPRLGIYRVCRGEMMILEQEFASDRFRTSIMVPDTCKGKDKPDAQRMHTLGSASINPNISRSYSFVTNKPGKSGSTFASSKRANSSACSSSVDFRRFKLLISIIEGVRWSISSVDFADRTSITHPDRCFVIDSIWPTKISDEHETEPIQSETPSNSFSHTEKQRRRNV